ncbi:MAG TPA: glycosyltransferase family 39 protein [Acidimicrobiales bacterium]|nr:glycosyltransferase family 39 protein [Acidimicrobiales bacterium]
MTRRAWRLTVGAAVLVGLAVRIGSVLGRPHLAPAGDAYQYLGQANLLAEGKGWIEPLIYTHTGVATETAKLPPLYTMLLAVCSVVGFKSFFAHRIWSAVLSAAGVGLGAVVGRDVAGPAVGVVAAFGMALYPNVWISAGMGMSETISPVVVLVVLWAAYRMWRGPTVGRAALLGLAVGLAALARDELAVLGVLILVPLAVGERGRPWRTRLRLLAAGAAMGVLVVGPWVAFNTVRFSRPVLITDSFGVTLAVANCDQAWNGPFAGYWWMPCAQAAVAGVPGDEPAVGAVATRRALDYVGSHLGDLPRVEMDRLGRTFGLYRPFQQINLDVHIESRPRLWAWVGLWSYYGLAALAPFGAWALKRRGVPLFPMVAILVDVGLASLVALGQTRFRAPLEPVLVLLAATAVCAAAGRLRNPRTGAARRPGSAGCREPSGPTSAGQPAGAPPSASVA